MKRIPVLRLASGDALTISVYTFPGTVPGARSAYLQSAVHGSEVQGSLVLALLIDYLEKNPPLGNVRIVPNANPMGINNKRGEYTDGRFDPVRGDNWNRKYFLPTTDFPWEKFLEKHKQASDGMLFAAFRSELRKALAAREPRSSGDRMALNLQRLSVDYDLCLDLHCANRSVRHAYIPSYAVKDAAYLMIPHQLIMPDDKFGGSMDEVFFAPWTALAARRRVGKLPVQGFTVELGNHEEVSRKEAERDLQAILNYLRHMGVVKGKAKPYKPKRFPLSKYTLVSAPVGGIAEVVATLGKPVRKGEVVARILTFGKKPEFHEVKAPISGTPILHHSSAVVLEGAELIKIAGS